jgi:hypothetical protein
MSTKSLRWLALAACAALIATAPAQAFWQSRDSNSNIIASPNLIAQGNEFTGTDWYPSQVVIAASGTAPNGLTAYSVLPGTGNALHRFFSVTAASSTGTARVNILVEGNGVRYVNFNTNSYLHAEVTIDTTTGPTVTSGTGTPQSAVTAPVGSLFIRSDGGANTTLYVKESGTGNTGWVAK